MARIKGKFAPLTEELGNDERFLLQSTDLDKLLYLLIIYTCHMTHHQAPVNPEYYKKRYVLRAHSGQIVASLRRISCLYPKLSWGEKNLSLLNSATYKNEIVHPSQKKNKNKKEKKRNITDEEFLTALKADPLNAHVDFDVEFLKMDRWLAKPENSHRKKTRRFIENWIGKVDRPIVTGTFTKEEDPWKKAPAL